jgi:hypothetical protein
MCLAVYLAAPAPLPVVPWRSDAPAFHVVEADPQDAARGHLPWPNVYRAMAADGCGCDLQDRGASRSALRSYVEEAVLRGPLKVYACWEGDQRKIPRHHATANPEDLGGEVFRLMERELLTFSAAQR